MSEPPIIELRGVSKVFRNFWLWPTVRAVDKLSFSIAPGTVFGLLGPNGSGKSTLIKLLLGLLRPSSGAIRVFESAPQAAKHKARLGYMPEQSYLHPYLSVKETLNFYANLLIAERTERRARVNELLELTDLGHVGSRRVNTLSKGLARRLDLAQALLGDPDLLLLDEPTSGLDPMGCELIKELIAERAARGKTVLICSHLLANVERVCSRIGILHQGRLCIEGSVEELLEENGRIQLSIPPVSRALTEEAANALRNITGEQPEITNARRSLEDLFLATIDQAKREA